MAKQQFRCGLFNNLLFRKNLSQMKNFILFFLSSMLIVGCQKQNIEPNPPNDPIPLPSDSTNIDSSLSLVGQYWVLTAYRIGEFGPILNRSDTLHFQTNQSYSFNQFPSTYSFYPAMASYNLTINETFLGNISGNVFSYNLFSGQIDGNKFTNITLGASSSDFYLWLKRI